MLRGTGTAERRRSGFTLAEMLVVMLIIAVLAALLIPAVFKVQDSTKRSETTWQMTQISQAADLFCNSEQMSRVGYLPSKAPFVLRPTHTIDISGNTDDEAKYLMQVFPGLEVRVNADGTRTLITNLGQPITLADTNQVVLFFLTGGESLNYQGFSSNARRPFDGPSSTPGEKRKGPFLQLKDGMTSPNPAGFTPNGQTWLVDPYKNPYAVFVSRSGTYPNQIFPLTGNYNGTTVSPYFRRSASTPTPPPKFENPKGIQVISAGRDKRFAAGGDWNAMADNKDAMDDSSNFSTAGLGYGPN